MLACAHHLFVLCALLGDGCLLQLQLCCLLLEGLEQRRA
jgi:hypothetical protein